MQEPLKVITIDDLEPGMYVHEILEQDGKLLVKNKGRVTKSAVVTTLKKRGVRKLVIDTSKQFDPENPDKPLDPPAEEPVKEEPKETVSFDDEIARAERIHKKGKNIQNKLLDAVKSGLPFDDKIPREFSKNMIESIDRNPDALLCLTKIREKDDYLLEHSLNVAILLANFGRFIGMSEQEIEDLAHAGFLHDIGKIRIPDEILHKPGRLTDMEMNIMRDHVYYGVRVLEEMEIESHLVRTVSEHHERLDGYGYPNGARGEEISKAGRMLAIADVYDALTADRCYKAGMSSQKALQILLNDAPSKLDKELVQLFIKCMGIYPVGSLVKLNNERIAMVVTQNEDKPLSPVVKIFYSLRGNHYIQPKDIDLSADTTVRIEKAVLASDYKINFNGFFSESIAI